jgi:hypothetical protein
MEASSSSLVAHSCDGIANLKLEAIRNLPPRHETAKWIIFVASARPKPGT